MKAKYSQHQCQHQQTIEQALIQDILLIALLMSIALLEVNEQQANSAIEFIYIYIYIL